MGVGDGELVIDREHELPSLELRASARRVDEMLDPDFRQIGSSGTPVDAWRDHLALSSEFSDGEGAIEVTEMAPGVVGPDLSGVPTSASSGSPGRVASSVSCLAAWCLTTKK